MKWGIILVWLMIMREIATHAIRYWMELHARATWITQTLRIIGHTVASGISHHTSIGNKISASSLWMVQVQVLL